MRLLVFLFIGVLSVAVDLCDQIYMFVFMCAYWEYMLSLTIWIRGNGALAASPLPNCQIRPYSQTTVIHSRGSRISLQKGGLDKQFRCRCSMQVFQSHFSLLINPHLSKHLSKLFELFHPSFLGIVDLQQICIVFSHIFYCSSVESTLALFVPIQEHHITVTAFPPPDSGNGISSQSKHRLRDQKMSKDNIDYINMESSQFMVGLYQKNLSLIQICIDFPLYCRDARKLSVQERKHFPSVWQAGLLLGNNCPNMKQI